MGKSQAALGLIWGCSAINPGLLYGQSGDNLGLIAGKSQAALGLIGGKSGADLIGQDDAGSHERLGKIVDVDSFFLVLLELNPRFLKTNENGERNGVVCFFARSDPHVAGSKAHSTI